MTFHVFAVYSRLEVDYSIMDTNKMVDVIQHQINIVCVPVQTVNALRHLWQSRRNSERKHSL